MNFQKVYSVDSNFILISFKDCYVSMSFFKLVGINLNETLHSISGLLWEIIATLRHNAAILADIGLSQILPFILADVQI